MALTPSWMQPTLAECYVLTHRVGIRRGVFIWKFQRPSAVGRVCETWGSMVMWTVYGLACVGLVIVNDCGFVVVVVVIVVEMFCCVMHCTVCVSSSLDVFTSTSVYASEHVCDACLFFFFFF